MSVMIFLGNKIFNWKKWFLLALELRLYLFFFFLHVLCFFINLWWFSSGNKTLTLISMIFALALELRLLIITHSMRKFILNKIYLFSLKVLCLAVAVGNVGMQLDELSSNVSLSVNFLVSLLKKNWQNVRSLYIKSSMGPAFRIY